jgi:thiamine-monophosphate kinase
MNEFELIAALSPSLASNSTVLTGAGDDCAVLDLGLPDRCLLFKTDAVVEGIHFNATARPEQIGRKALGRCLSDIAAMGGRPQSALITLALPNGFDAKRIVAIYDGINALARRFGVAIAGGETTTNPERLLLSVAMLGDVPRGKAVLRSGARAGDAIFVSGELGGSILGRHLEFEPRVNEAQWLAGRFDIHAMIDISDGLVNDLRHILKASATGAELLAKSIPISRAARLHARDNLNSGKTPLAAALGDGEDFELLFCAASRDAVTLLDAWKAQFPNVRLTCIGKTTAEPGLKLRDKTGLHELESHGYIHFA